jgi:hypothetical protein
VVMHAVFARKNRNKPSPWSTYTRDSLQIAHWGDSKRRKSRLVSLKAVFVLPLRLVGVVWCVVFRWGLQLPHLVIDCIVRGVCHSGVWSGTTGRSVSERPRGSSTSGPRGWGPRTTKRPWPRPK